MKSPTTIPVGAPASVVLPSPGLASVPAPDPARARPAPPPRWPGRPRHRRWTRSRPTRPRRRRRRPCPCRRPRCHSRHSARRRVRGWQPGCGSVTSWDEGITRRTWPGGVGNDLCLVTQALERKRARVLVIDDAAHHLTDALSDSLSGHDVDVAGDAVEAIYRIDCETGAYSVIFCDLARGDLPGPELVGVSLDPAVRSREAHGVRRVEPARGRLEGIPGADGQSLRRASPPEMG